MINSIKKNGMKVLLLSVVFLQSVFLFAEKENEDQKYCLLVGPATAIHKAEYGNNTKEAWGEWGNVLEKCLDICSRNQQKRLVCSISRELEVVLKNEKLTEEEKLDEITNIYTAHGQMNRIGEYLVSMEKPVRNQKKAR